MMKSNAAINKESLYKALTATERLALYKKHNFTSGDFTPFQNWINTRGVITEADIYNMLNICNITAEDFNLAIKALSQNEIEQITMTDDAGEWYKQFDEIVADYFDGLFQEKISALNNDSTPIDLSMSIAPFILYFKKKIDKIRGDLKHVTLSQVAFTKMIQKLSSVLVSLSIKTLVWELHCFPENMNTPKKDTNTADRKFKLFISKTFFDKENFFGFYYKYPVIARRMIVKCEHIITHFSEMLMRFDDNFRAISDAFKIEDIPTEITDIDCDEGDTHQQGRFVVKIHLSNLVILYKPRNLMVQKIFYEIINYLNENTVLLDMYVHKAFYGDSYTFDSYVEYKECKNETQVNRYYGRFGQLCSLIWVLCGNDIHYENIIAHSEYPVIIDVETLFQHQSSILNMPKSAVYKAYSECIDSVGGTAMIPIITHSKGDKQRGVDISALAGDEQVLPFQILALKDINTDSMHYEYSDVTMQGAKNIPMLMDNKVNFFDYVEKILDGFNFCMRFIQEHKSEFIRLIHKFDDIVVRQLMKSTINYAKLMDFSSHPNYSQDMIKLERMFHNAWSYNYNDKRIIAAEVSDMLFGDIPLFYSKVDSRDILTSSGEIIEDYFDSPALDKAINRVRTLSDSEILKQLAQIKICLGLYLVENDKKSAQREEKTYIPTAIDIFGEDRKILLLKAKEIADVIINTAIYDHQSGTVTWNNVLYDDINKCWKVRPLDDGFVHGLSGLLLLFYLLNKVVPEKKYANMANKILQTIESIPPTNPEAMSSVFPLLMLYRDTKNYSLYTRMHKIINVATSSGHSFSSNDYIDGRSGALKIVTELYRLTHEDIYRQAAKKITKEIISSLYLGSTDKLDISMGHGLSGIYFSLRAFCLVEYSEEIDNICVSIKEIIIKKIGYLNDSSWEFGLAGVILALSDDKKLMVEHLNLLIDMIVNEKSDSLSCGKMGTIDVFLETCDLLSENPNGTKVNEIIASIINRQKANGDYNYITIEGFPTVGLFYGLGGIAYTFLRLYEKGIIPNILMMQQ